MKPRGIWGAGRAGLAGLFIVLAGCARIEPPPAVASHSGAAIALSNAELDGITAGIGANAAGAGEAEGLSSWSTVNVYTAVGLGNPRNAAVVGQVTSRASSTRPEIPATAISVLHLSIDMR